MSGPAESADPTGYDALVIGAGHNGLVTAAYLARGGMRTMLVEARDTVGGTAATVPFGGGRVNICNCDHVVFRTTPIIEELGLAQHGLEYLDVEPAQYNLPWNGGPAWALWKDGDATLESLARTYPSEVDGYRRYLAAATPVVEMIFAAAVEPPTLTGLGRVALRRRLAGVPTLMRWARRSAADVMRSFFGHHAVSGSAMVTGPMVWGISPELPGSGLGALTHAMRHVGTLGRPVGGSGMVPTSLLSAFEESGGTLRTGAKVSEIRCEAGRVRGVSLVDGTEIDAPVIVSACNPHDTFLRWLRNPPAAAEALIERWRGIPIEGGYESKIDAILTEAPRLLGVDGETGPTTVVTPTLGEIDSGYHLMQSGEILPQPGLLVQTPSVLDPSLAPEGKQVFSLEALFTPYDLAGGWPGSRQPERWLEEFATLCEPGFLDSIEEWRPMTPDVYERDFHLPAGHATSFAGGPLAAFRSKDPELTNYETAVRGLYLTGAATFPGAGVWGASGRNCAAIVLARHA